MILLPPWGIRPGSLGRRSPGEGHQLLGDSAVTFTLQTYTHVIPGMDQDAADTVAQLILGGSPEPEVSRSRSMRALLLVAGAVCWSRT